MNYWQLAALTGLRKTRKEKNAINIDTGRISTRLTQVFLLEESASSVQQVAWQQMAGILTHGRREGVPDIFAEVQDELL